MDLRYKVILFSTNLVELTLLTDQEDPHQASMEDRQLEQELAVHPQCQGWAQEQVEVACLTYHQTCRMLWLE